MLEFDKEESFLKNNSLLFSVYYILEGEIKLRDSNKCLFSILGEGDFLGLNTIYNNSPIRFSARAIKNSKVIQFEKTILQKILSTNSLFLSKILEKIGEDFDQVLFNLLEYRKNTINGALASFLLYYSDKNCLKDLTRREIGEILGYSRENITKTLKSFCKEKYISISGKEVSVINKNLLKKIKCIG